MQTPVTFTYEGKEYTGELSKVAGGGNSSLFHLTVNGYHWGQLFYTDKWEFYSNTKNLGHLAEYFGGCVIAAGDSALP